ncbi:DUF1990 family protein [Kitasatospora fiedleri]|uniref:DUF1990 family protein n=1 Tax=Kitasatospora fiedleri TaxID=2991545 RepID=UPI00384E40B4
MRRRAQLPRGRRHPVRRPARRVRPAAPPGPPRPRTRRAGTGGAYVLGWGVQLGSGFAIHPAPGRMLPGDTVLLRLALPGLRLPRLVIPCRVVWTVEEPDRIGFAYGTLPGHPERGEESFVVSRDADGEVWFEITAFFRLAAWYARLGRPVALLLQHLAIERYLRVVARTAAREGSGRPA